MCEKASEVGGKTNNKNRFFGISFLFLGLVWSRTRRLSKFFDLFSVPFLSKLKSASGYEGGKPRRRRAPDQEGKGAPANPEHRLRSPGALRHARR